MTYTSDEPPVATMPRFFAGVEGLLTRPLSCKDLVATKDNIPGSNRRKFFGDNSGKRKRKLMNTQDAEIIRTHSCRLVLWLSLFNPRMPCIKHSMTHRASGIRFDGLIRKTGYRQHEKLVIKSRVKPYDIFFFDTLKQTKR
jgi:hypothetical protein